MLLTRLSRHAPALAAILGLACSGHAAPGKTEEPSPAFARAPAAVADELLAADRAFAAASGSTDIVAGLTRMLGPDVVMPVPGGFAVGRDSVLAAIRANPANTGATLTWTPVRVGVSADGRQGFTLGYATFRGGDGATTPGKYLTYWVKGQHGWQAVVYRRRRSGGDAPTTLMPPALPAKSVAASSDAAATERFRQSLDSAERAFSRDAQEIGLRAAFARYGSPDATNMGPADRPTFVVGADSIGIAVSEGEPATGSSVSWAPDHDVIVASSGDLGVTVGTIVTNEPDSTGAKQSFPFFTVWRRASPDQPWRYVAE
jgi:ketosteroid isomerase-like protein